MKTIYKNLVSLHFGDKNISYFFSMGKKASVWTKVYNHFNNKENGYEINTLYKYPEVKFSNRSMSFHVIAVSEYSMEVALKTDCALQFETDESIETYWTVRFDDFHLLFTHIFYANGEHEYCVEKSKLKDCLDEMKAAHLIRNLN